MDNPEEQSGGRKFAALFKEISRSQHAGKCDSHDRAALEKSLDLLLRIGSELGVTIGPASRVLDFGCGLGETVEILLSRGIEAYGVDVGEWWGKDFDAYWQKGDLPAAGVLARLHSINEDRYVLPFPDDSFDLIISTATFEHVFNYETVFREIHRVLKPTGISVNIFPGRWSPVEPHVGIPIIPLCKHNWWLALWALRRGTGVGWREHYHSLQGTMKLTCYPTRKQVRRYAAAAGAHLEFCERLYVALSASRPNRIVRAASRFGLGRVVSAAVERVCQRTMVLRKRTAPGLDSRGVGRASAQHGAITP
ncbi:MAG: hypothetical protein QOC81_340 [Thermoanaerobaculia bacterium]|jgi:SAM-dependent methyltransferase|nr:hypothetical protein [Thermoanaerobaculia bacterium]